MSRANFAAWLPLVVGLMLACLSLPAIAQTTRIVAFGDSNTAGYGIKRAVAYPAQLEALLRERGYDVTVTNAGVSGDMTTDAIARMDRAIPDGTDAVIVFLGRNDWRKGTPRSAIEKNLGTIVGRLRQRDIEVLLVGFAPLDFSAIAKQYGAIYYPDFFDGVTVLGRKMRKYRLREVFHHLNPDGYAVVVGRLAPSAESLVARANGP